VKRNRVPISCGNRNGEHKLGKIGVVSENGEGVGVVGGRA